MLSRTVPEFVDVVEPGLIRDDPGCHEVFQEAVGQAWDTRNRLLALGVEPGQALYVLPNALVVRFEESGSLLHLMHKWTMRTCLNAQREIYEASMDEVEQVRVALGLGPDDWVSPGAVCSRWNTRSYTRTN